MKTAIRYLRYSSKGQSNSSIEAQDLHTTNWIKNNNVTVIDTFIDAGYSAKTFDRPDIKKLTEFIHKHHKNVDYLVVSEMDRFSRDAGEAITTIKKLQQRYNVQIVSAVEGIIYDYRDSASFFRTGLSFLLAEDDNIRRAGKINSGIYTAKAKEGRFIGSKPPYGYLLREGGKNRTLAIDPEKAKIVQIIYNRFLCNVPQYMILKEIKSYGFNLTSNSIIEKILQNPIYSAQQYVKPLKTNPGGLFPANWEAIIDIATWQAVQDKLNGKYRQERKIIDDAFPLRASLSCFCGQKVTGAYSKGKLKSYPYYKCKQGKGHLNINANKANAQIDEIFEYLSLPDEIVNLVFEKAKQKIEVAMAETKHRAVYLKTELAQIENRIKSAEDKFIADEITSATYNRVFNDLMQKKAFTIHQLNECSINNEKAQLKLYENVYKLKNMGMLWKSATTLQKQAIIDLVFDRKLHHDGVIYRTPYIMNLFSHKILILRTRKLLDFGKKGSPEVAKLPLGGAEGGRTPVQTYLP